MAMSYDLMVYEKGKAPMDQQKFMGWYNEKIESGSSKGISYASEKLQIFFHSVRNIFPPMDGPFAQDNMAMEKPEMEKYLCGYSIMEDLIYLTFSHSVSRFAYDVIKRAAYFADVGFFEPSGNGMPIVFDSLFPMLLEGEWFHPHSIDNFESVSEKLDDMGKNGHSYFYITDQIGNYIQIGGYGNSYTVEKRIYTSPGAYVHTKAQYSNMETVREEGVVTIAGNSVRLKQSQILTKDVARQLLLSFFQGVEFMDFIEWIEMDL